MRVISGSAKGNRLVSVPGKSTRPITDQVKEALFNILSNSIVGSHFLDLFGGTGAVGIEALSRGAEDAVFLDTNHRAYKVIQQNLQSTGLDEFASVYKKDAFTFLRDEPSQQFDFIFIAPPQYQGYWIKAMQLLDQNPDWSILGGVAIVQIHPKEDIDDYGYANFKLHQRRNYGDTELIFFERVSSK